jgi:ABC-type Zn uptake system ZnuABC Zn-binding protein ZnuA
MGLAAVRTLGVALAIGAVWIGGGPGSAQDERDPLKAVATFSILGDLVRNVGGEAIELTTIVQPGADAHNFEPTPQDADALAEADVVFANGWEFEPWLDDLYDASGSDATIVTVTDGITPLAAGAHEHDGDAGQDDEQEHGSNDPHVWHDVALAMTMVEAIRTGLVAADPVDAAVFEANAQAYLAQLRALDDFVVAEVAKLPEDRRKLVTSHDTFAYFAARYGFEIVGTAFGSVTTEGADPSAEEISALVDEIAAAGVPAIFAENVSNPALMESIAAEAGVVLAPTLYTDALGESGSDGDTYEKMIRANVTTIVAALGQ